MKKILFILVALMVAVGASAAKSTSQVRIYINPGHGSWGGEDRHMGTVTHGAANYTDTCGFYESNTNLEKGFGMLEKLIEYGIPFDRNKNLNNSNAARRGAALDLSQTNLVMSRVKNGPYPHDGSTYGAYSRNLSEIAAECESWNADIMISIHSNAATEGTTTNYPLFLYRGYTNSEQNAGSSAACKACWPHWWKNQHMMWTYYSATNMNVQGDWTFASSWGTQGYGILRHTVPGFLVEGYFHTYQPARHKAMNWEACRWEGQRYAKGFNDYFGWGKKDSYGTIYGVLRDGEQTFSHTYYTPNSSTLDKYKPVNNATVTLKNSSGQVVQTYKTDDEYNGVFVFDKVPAGTYSMTFSHPDYKDFSQSVTVTANETTFPTPLFQTEQIAARGHYAYGLSSSNSGSTYTLKFKSTGDVSNGTIIFTNNSTGASQSIKTGAIKKGENTVTFDAKTLGENAQFSWSVAIDNPVSTGVELLYSDNSIVYNNGSANARIGIAIDNDQTSANFGTIYTLTAMGQGLQKYNPDFSKNGGKVITGMFGKDTDASTSSYKFYRSNRIEVENGKVYIANYANYNTGMWEYDPATNASPRNITNVYYERALAFVGEGSSRKVFSSHENNLQRFDIGTGTSWTSGSPAKSYTTAGVMDNGDGDVLVTDNAVIVSQCRYSGNNLAQNPAFAVFDHNLNLIYKSDAINSTLNGSENGGMAISADYKTFAIANSYTSSGNSGVVVQVYSVTWSGSTPTFVHKHTVPLNGTYRVDQMEFDLANNLYIASQQKGLLVYAIKNPARQTVTKANSTIQGQALPAVRGHYAYGLKMSQNGNKYTLTFKSTGAVESANVVLTPAQGDAVKVKINGVKAGDNTVEIDATTLATGVKYTWAVALDNPASPSVEQYFSDNSIIYNNGSNDARIGVAIDNDPTSANFGNIYTITAMGQGMQRYNPDYSKNGGKVITGMFGKDTDASTSTNKFVRSNRIEVENGKVYIANYANMNSGMWEYDPATNASPRNITNVYYERAIAFYGEGTSRKVFSSHENNLQRFDIGTGTSWTSGSPAKNYTVAGVLDNGDGDVLVTDKAVIVSQNRFAGNNASQNPAFAVFDHNLNLVYKSDAINATLNGSDNGGMAISADYKTFAIADSYTGSGRSGVSVQIYSVTWNGATPTFTHKYAILLDGTKVVDQMEFDYAGNLVIASQQKGLLAYAIKTDARTTTTNAATSMVIEGVQAPLYITGSNVGGNWDPANAAEFEFDGTNYSITLTEATTEFKISTIKGSWEEFNAGNLAVDAAITNGGTVNLSVNKDGQNIVLPWAGVWTITVADDLSTLTAKTETPEPVYYPAAVYMVGHDGTWDPANPLEIVGENGVYVAEGVNFSNTTFKLSTAKGSWDDFNAAGLNAASNFVAIGEEVALIAGTSANNSIVWIGTYNVKIDLVNSTITLNGTPAYPEVIYTIGNINGYNWSTSEGVALAHVGNGIFEGEFEIDNADNGFGYFQFATTLGADWDAVNAGTRYGATEPDKLIEANNTYNMTNNWGSDSQSWKSESGKCRVQVNIVNCTMQILEFTGVEGITINNNANSTYYNLQGVKIANPANGTYIKVEGNKSSKVYIK
ncbi:MAG: carboxypeptidase regulatory-like domain-containing protein [Muribaculaceae bacterium]|nr:carboxypeptidase regulatory-like domain-containing protein [Muribaculaceae bacterium]